MTTERIKELRERFRPADLGTYSCACDLYETLDALESAQAELAARPDMDALITENEAKREIILKQAAELAALRAEIERLKKMDK